MIDLTRPFLIFVAQDGTLDFAHRDTARRRALAKTMLPIASTQSEVGARVLRVRNARQARPGEAWKVARYPGTPAAARLLGEHLDWQYRALVSRAALR